MLKYLLRKELYHVTTNKNKTLQIPSFAHVLPLLLSVPSCGSHSSHHDEKCCEQSKNQNAYFRKAAAFTLIAA